jgi:mono/diheme cytochrome c family protein
MTKPWYFFLVGGLAATVLLAFLLLAPGSPPSTLSSTLSSTLQTQAPAATADAEPQLLASADSPTSLVNQYCVVCHNEALKTGGLALDSFDVANAHDNPDVWERVLRKLRANAMPPTGMPRPDEESMQNLVGYLEDALDSRAAADPNPGRTPTFSRLNRFEYQNAIRDMLALEVDVSGMLPTDDSSFGFDNVNVTNFSPTLMERYLSAAQKISRLAIGAPMTSPTSHVELLAADLTQENRFEGLPFGTRGGTAFDYNFQRDGNYQLQVRLSRDRNENVEGLTELHELEITLDGERLGLFEVTPQRSERFATFYYSDESAGSGLEVEIPVTAGSHEIGVAFLRKNSALIESTRQPYLAHFNRDRHPRQQPAVHSVSIAGPYAATGVSDTPSRQRIFICQPQAVAAEAACARDIIASLARRAFRRPVNDADIQSAFAHYQDASAVGGFEAGIETALRGLLVSPEFIFRIEQEPADIAADTIYTISDVELASRLSFFLWSSIPDDELLDLAAQGELRNPEQLAQQVRRMLADPRSRTLVTNFASQWLYLRNLDAVDPNTRLFPDFDDNLRQAMRRETEMLFDSVVQQDQNVMQLLAADYTFLNERLAKHYGIANVYGDHFRQVSLPADSQRIGLLGHGSILTVTSYANRTSPVLRGKWVLENLLGIPPPPPPDNVPALSESETDVKALTMRERMVQHRANPVCAACHQVMDPVGLTMENFDAVGRWRAENADHLSIDVSGNLPGSEPFEGVAGLRSALLENPDAFVGTMSEKLLTYAIGRGLEYYDAPAVRDILRQTSSKDYRFSAMILAIVNSTPFQMRRSL